MIKKLPYFVLFIFIIFFSACAGRNSIILHQIPEQDKIFDLAFKKIDFNSIIETKDGIGNSHIPAWLFEYIEKGSSEAEDTYYFIGNNTGNNFIALSKWALNFTVVHDFPRLVAARIEKRLVLASYFYPDNEYGRFFEVLLKKSFDGDYPGAIKEETYWIKTTNNNEETNEDETNGFGELYEFFVLISIDKTVLQTIIRGMMAETIEEITPTRAQNTAIRRLQQSFFEGF